MNTLKNLQNQLDFIQEKNKKLTNDNQELTKANSNLKKEIEKLSKECSTNASDNHTEIGRLASTTSLEGKFMEHMLDKKTEREVFLETNLHELEKKLYEKEKAMKKL